MPGVLLWGFYPATKKWIPLQVDADGYVKVDMSAIHTLLDADGDTGWDVEQAPDEDKIHGKVKGVEAFLLDDAGVLTLAKQSGVRAYLSADQAIGTGIWTKVNLDLEVFDIQSEFDTANYKFTAKKAGIYLIIVNTAWSGVIGADHRAGAAAFKNGASIFYRTVHTSHAASLNANGVLIEQLAVGDEIDLRAYQDSGANVNAASGVAQTFLVLFKLA